MLQWPPIPSPFCQAVIDELPVGVLVSDAIRNVEGRIINFRHRLFNRQAQQDLPALADWFEGVTMWELFKDDARAGLFETYKTVCETGVSQRGVYYSRLTGKWYQSRIEPTATGVVAMGMVFPELHAVIALLDDSADDAGLLAQRLHQYQVPLQVEHFNSADAFVETLTQGHLKPALVLVDLNLSSSLGMTVLSQFALLGEAMGLPQMPIVTWTRDPSLGDKKASYRAGAQLVLNKANYELETLLELAM